MSLRRIGLLREQSGEKDRESCGDFYGSVAVRISRTKTNRRNDRFLQRKEGMTRSALVQLWDIAIEENYMQRDIILAF